MLTDTDRDKAMIGRELTVYGDAPSSCTSGLLCSVWIPTDYETGKIDELSDPVFSDGDIDFEPKLSAGWVWREYKLMPVTPNTDVCGERSESVERSG